MLKFFSVVLRISSLYHPVKIQYNDTTKFKPQKILIADGKC